MRKKILMLSERLLKIMNSHYDMTKDQFLEKNLSTLFYWGAERYARHGCNDLPHDFWNGWTKSERQEFVKTYHKWNGDPEEYNPEFLELPDFAVMRFIAEYLSGKVKFKQEERKDKLLKINNL